MASLTVPDSDESTVNDIGWYSRHTHCTNVMSEHRASNDWMLEIMNGRKRGTKRSRLIWVPVRNLPEMTDEIFRSHLSGAGIQELR